MLCDINSGIPGSKHEESAKNNSISEKTSEFISIAENCGSSDAENSIYIPFDIITFPFVLLSRYEEFHAKDHDEHGRFQFKGSLMDKYKLVEIPIVDEYAMLLRRWLCLYFPDSFQAISRPPRIVPTHDMDILCRFTSRWQALKSIFGRDLLINRDLKMVWESIKSYRNSLGRR